MLEHAHRAANGIPERALEWYSKGVTVEHVMSRAASGHSDAFEAALNQIGNLALLEQKLNHALGSKGFSQKRPTYKDSEFVLTQQLADEVKWGVDEIEAHTGTRRTGMQSVARDIAQIFLHTLALVVRRWSVRPRQHGVEHGRGWLLRHRTPPGLPPARGTLGRVAQRGSGQ